jgi:hypothetical protein
MDPITAAAANNPQRVEGCPATKLRRPMPIVQESTLVGNRLDMTNPE